MAAVAGCMLLAAVAGCGSRLLTGPDRLVYLDGGEGYVDARATSRVRSSRSDWHIKQASYQAEAASKPTDATTAATPREMTVDQALIYTLDNHPRLRARAQEVEVARAALITAGLCPNPQLVLDTDTPINESGPVELSGRLVFTIPTGGKRGYAAAAAEAGVVQAEWAIDSESHLLLVETADAALEVLYLQELVKLQRELTQLAVEAAALQRARVEGGGASAAQALAAEIDAVDIEFDALNNEALLEAARVRLSKALGLARPEELQIKGALSVVATGRPALDELLAEVARIRPELAQAEAAIEKSRRGVAAAAASAIPDIQLGPRFGTELERRGDSNVGVRFGMDLPWFDRKEGDIYEAASQARVNEALRDEVRMTSLHDVANAYLQLRPIEAALAQYEQKIVPIAAQIEELLHDREAALALDPVEVSDQLRKLVQIRLKHLKLRYTHNRIRMQLELLLGRRLDGGAAGGAAGAAGGAAGDGTGGIEPELLPPGAEARPADGREGGRMDGGRGGAPGNLEHGGRIRLIAPAEEERPSDPQWSALRSPEDVAADAAEFLDASNWKPNDKERGARFRR